MATLTYVGYSDPQNIQIEPTYILYSNFKNAVFSIGDDITFFFFSTSASVAGDYTVTDSAGNPYTVFFLGTATLGPDDCYFYVATSPSIAGVPTSITNTFGSAPAGDGGGVLESWNSGGYLTSNLDAYSSNGNSGSSSSVTITGLGDVIFSWFYASTGFSAYPTGWVAGVANAGEIWSAGIISTTVGNNSIPWSGTGNNQINAAAFFAPVPALGGITNLMRRPFFGRGGRW